MKSLTINYVQPAHNTCSSFVFMHRKSKEIHYFITIIHVHPSLLLVLIMGEQYSINAHSMLDAQQ